MCCAWLGAGGAGTFVKMVHNGIEYGDMQLIAEAYDLEAEQEQQDELDKAGKTRLIADVAAALYASKICSYAQGLSKGWQLDLGRIAAIWKGGCIIRITAAYAKDAALASLLVNEDFSAEISAA